MQRSRETTAYQNKLTDPETAVRAVRDGDAITVPTGAGEPPALLKALAGRKQDLRGVTIWQTLPVRNYGLADPETADNIRYSTMFLGGTTRKGAQEGWAPAVPGHFSDMPELYRRKLYPCDVVLAIASPMDAHGYFSISLGTDYTMAAMTMAREVILEVNENVPFCYGDCHIHVDQVTTIVENNDPLIELPHAPYTDEEKAMGALVADLIPDGATIQMGIGGVPNAVVAQLSEKNDLGIHTEMMGEGILRLVESGVVTNRKKNIRPGLMMATFALGSKALYEFMDHNPMIEMHPVDVTNDPFNIGQHDNLHSINSTLQVDLIGQCGSESIGSLPYSGTGGQADFVRGANRSKGGKAIIVVPSTAKGGEVSRIAPVLLPGTHVTTHKNDVNYVVTEFGVAQLRGKSYADRARALIEIAHPKFRDELTEAAKEHRIFR